MTIALGIMHVPRSMPTLADTLESLTASGYTGEVYVYPDGFDHDRCPADLLRFTSSRVGLVKHYFRVLRDLLDNTTADVVMVHADDFRYLTGWSDLLPRLLTNEVAYVQTYVPKGLAERNGWGRGVHRFNGGWATSWGGGYAYTRTMAEAMLTDPIITEYEGNRHLDHIIPEWAAKRGHVQLFPVPSLTAHIGMTSTIGNLHTGHENPAGW